MQTGMIDGLLSCGNWVKALLDRNNFLKKVFWIGTSYDSVCAIDEKYNKRYQYFSENDIGQSNKWKRFVNRNISGPLYVSIDKDVLSSDYAITGWNHGNMTLYQIKEYLSDIYRKGDVAH